MADWTKIANIALGELGGETIMDINESSEAARAIKNRHEDVRDAVLRAHPWNCALARAALAAGPTPGWGYGFSYPLPADPYCLRVLGIEDSRIKFKVEGRSILTDQPGPLRISFIRRVANPEEFDALLVQAIAYRLAAAVAFKMTGSNTAADRVWSLYQAVLREARSMDAQEGTPDDIEASELLDSRY